MNHYEAGELRETIDLLTRSVGRLSQSGQRDAYELMAKAYIEDGYIQEAVRAVQRLLLVDEGFEYKTTDLYEFRQLVDEVRAGSAVTTISSVSKIAESLEEAPATVILLTEDEIQRRGYLDLEALIHDLPGFDISRGNGVAYSNIYQRGYRSSSTNRTLLLVDGVEENDLWSNIAWISRQYPLSNVKRVEVVYGPTSTMYGANAFLGVINVITKDPEELIGDGERIGLRGQGNVGQWNTRYADVTMAGKYENMAFSLAGRLYSSDEMDLSKLPDSEWAYDLPDADEYERVLTVGDDAPTEDEIGQAIDFDRLALSQRLNSSGLEDTNGEPIRFTNTTYDWLLYGKMKISNDFVAGFQTWRREEGSIGWYRALDRASSDNGTTWIPRLSFFYLKYDKEVVNNRLWISSFTRYKVHDLDKDTKVVRFRNYARGFLKLENLREGTESYWQPDYFYKLSKQLRTELKAVYVPSRRFNVVGGLELRSNVNQGDYLRSSEPDAQVIGTDGESDRAGGNNFNSRDFGVYAQASYRLNPQVKLVLGQRFDHNKIRIDEGYGWEANSRAAIVATPGDYVLKAMFSQAFKDADNRARYSSFGIRRPNQELDPETVDNFEVSLGRKIADGMFADLVGYTAFYNNPVELFNLTETVTVEDSTVTVKYTQNRSLGRLRISGLQANASFGFRNYSGYGNYTHTRPVNTEREDENRKVDKSELRIGDIASHRFNAGINAIYWQKLNINLRANYVGERKTGASTTVAGNPNSSIDAYVVVNCAVGYRAWPGGLLQLVVNNLFDEMYYHPGVRGASGSFVDRLPQNERNVMLRLLVDY